MCLHMKIIFYEVEIPKYTDVRNSRVTKSSYETELRHGTIMRTRITCKKILL